MRERVVSMGGASLGSVVHFSGSWAELGICRYNILAKSCDGHPLDKRQPGAQSHGGRIGSPEVLILNIVRIVGRLSTQGSNIPSLCPVQGMGGGIASDLIKPGCV